MTKQQVKEVGVVKVQAQLSTAVLHSLFDKGQAVKDDKSVAEAERTRMSTIVSAVKATSDTEIKAAIKGYIDDFKKEANWKSPKENGPRPAIVQIAYTRMSEFGTLAGALKHADLRVEPGKVGYHTAVTLARVALKEKGLRPDGTPGKTADERNVDRMVKIQTTKQKAVNEKAAELVRQLKRPLTVEEAQKLQADAEKLSTSATALDLARSIVITHGVMIAEQVAALITQAIQEWEAAQESLENGDTPINVRLAKKAMEEAQVSIKH